jgi:hypothetical protein
VPQSDLQAHLADTMVVIGTQSFAQALLSIGDMTLKQFAR